MRPIAALIGDGPLNETLETDSNEQISTGGSHVASIVLIVRGGYSGGLDV
jgi:hypothetical protein